MILAIKDLPIYEEPEEIYNYEYITTQPSGLEKQIRSARLKTQCFLSEHQETISKARHVYETGKAHSKEAFYSILDEENISARAGIITFGGIIGVLNARKSGILKKLTYGTIGASAVAALLYPKEAYNMVSKESIRLKKLSVIAYNFALGAKPKEKKEPVDKPLKSFEQVIDDSDDTMYWGFRLKHYEDAKPEILLEVTKPIVLTEEIKTTVQSTDFPRETENEALITDTKSSEKSGSKKEYVSEEDQLTLADVLEENISSNVASKDKVLEVTQLPKITVEGDLGQGLPEDQELYTTRQ
ncbi:uncharacterized protein LOC136028708 isoform X1 [Artemia franciscana]|uniref:uncharacterized protein LOC136028708 isoform X1 n=1 Tax=Artemia franciscana TaxID=6661 RepID=UPI0032DA4FA6